MYKALKKILVPYNLIYCCFMCSFSLKKLVNTIENPEEERMIVGTISLENRRFFSTGYFLYFANDSIMNDLKSK